MRNNGKSGTIITIIYIIFLMIVCFPSVASDPPDSAINPVSGNIETTDSVWNADSYQVRHVIHLGDRNGRDVFNVSTDRLDDNGPRLAISDEGDTWVVWWRESELDEVLIRKREYSSGEWLDEQFVSSRSEGGRNPEIVWDGSHPWIVHEGDAAAGTSIIVSDIHDDPNPVGSAVVLSTTGYGGDLDSLIHCDGDHLWVSWIDGAAYVGWSEYDRQTEMWESPSFEEYANGGVEAARERIRDSVVGE